MDKETINSGARRSTLRPWLPASWLVIMTTNCCNMRTSESNLSSVWRTMEGMSAPYGYKNGCLFLSPDAIWHLFPKAKKASTAQRYYSCPPLIFLNCKSSRRVICDQGSRHGGLSVNIHSQRHFYFEYWLESRSNA